MKLSRSARQQIVENLREHRLNGTLNAELVRDTARANGVSDSYVYRLARDGVVELERRPWRLTDRAVELYYEKRKVCKVIPLLQKEDPSSPGERQIYRAFREQLDSDELAFIRWGAVRRRSRSGCIRWEARERNAVWQTDHVKLGVPVLLPGHTKPKRLWLTYFIDCYSRMVMGWMVSVRESSDAVLEALRDAILIDEADGKPHGGKPKVVMFDNGMTFLALVIDEAAGLLDFRCRPVEPYSPHRNGKVERCHQTISSLALGEIPSWKNGPRDKTGKLYSSTPIAEHTLIERIDAAVRYYNFERPHSALRGRTPWQRFSADRTRLRREAPERLRFALRHRKPHKVQTSGVWKHGRYYRHDVLDTRVGDDVIVAWLRKDQTHVDVYDLKGKFLCTARPHEVHSEEEVREAKRKERQRYAAQDRKLRNAISNGEERYSPTNKPDGLKIVTVSTARPSGDNSSTSHELKLLEALGLGDAVASRWNPEGRAA